MKSKLTIKFLDDKLDVLLLNLRDEEFIRIMNKMHSHVYKNKKKYNRKLKHKNKEEE